MNTLLHTRITRSVLERPDVAAAEDDQMRTLVDSRKRLDDTPEALLVAQATDEGHDAVFRCESETSAQPAGGWTVEASDVHRGIDHVDPVGRYAVDALEFDLHLLCARDRTQGPTGAELQALDDAGVKLPGSGNGSEKAVRTGEPDPPAGELQPFPRPGPRHPVHSDDILLPGVRPDDVDQEELPATPAQLHHRSPGEAGAFQRIAHTASRDGKSVHDVVDDSVHMQGSPLGQTEAVDLETARDELAGEQHVVALDAPFEVEVPVDERDRDSHDRPPASARLDESATETQAQTRVPSRGVTHHGQSQIGGTHRIHADRLAVPFSWDLAENRDLPHATLPFVAVVTGERSTA